jgi:hypothetical protein
MVDRSGVAILLLASLTLFAGCQDGQTLTVINRCGVDVELKVREVRDDSPMPTGADADDEVSYHRVDDGERREGGLTDSAVGVALFVRPSGDDADPEPTIVWFGPAQGEDRSDDDNEVQLARDRCP